MVFHGTSAVCPKPLHQTYTGPTVLTPYYPELLTVSAAGDFEGVLSFGIGLAAQGGYHVFTLTSPDRLVIDVSHVALGKFPGIWDITSWPQYWATQYSWLNGHQPWLSSPSFVVQVWAGGYGSASVVRQVSANTFKVTKPDGKTFTVTGVRPVSVPGPWVITKIATAVRHRILPVSRAGSSQPVILVSARASIRAAAQRPLWTSCLARRAFCPTPAGPDLRSGGCSCARSGTWCGDFSRSAGIRCGYP